MAGREEYLQNILAQGGREALDQWLELEKLLEPLQRGAALFPAAAVRSDPGVILTSARFLGLEMALTGLVAGQLTVRLEFDMRAGGPALRVGCLCH